MGGPLAPPRGLRRPRALHKRALRPSLWPEPVEPTACCDHETTGARRTLNAIMLRWMRPGPASISPVCYLVFFAPRHGLIRSSRIGRPVPGSDSGVPLHPFRHAVSRKSRPPNLIEVDAKARPYAPRRRSPGAWIVHLRGGTKRPPTRKASASAQRSAARGCRRKITGSPIRTSVR